MRGGYTCGVLMARGQFARREGEMRVLNLMLVSVGCVVVVGMSAGCSFPQPWPEEPLYEFPENDADWERPATKAEAMAAIEGRYAHYDIVAYEGTTANGPLSTFIVSYGYTDFVIEDDELVMYDRFCSASYIANQNFETIFSDAATQSIDAPGVVVDVYREGGEWKVYRPATPTLVGIDGDPSEPLSMDRNDPLLSDDDGDGKPGVTVVVRLFGLIEGEIYIARREIFRNEMTLFSDGSLRGRVIDDSEQLVLGASLFFLDTPNNPPQRRDPGLNPIILIPVAAEVDTCEELAAMRDALFPEEPSF